MGLPMASATGVRLTLRFNFPSVIHNCGWSESYDLGYADLPTANAAKNAINALINLRLQTLGAGPVLVSAFLAAYVVPTPVGSAPIRRVTLALPVPALPTNYGFGSTYNKDLTGMPADYGPTCYYMSAQTNLAGTPVYRRNIWLAGLADAADEASTTAILGGFTQTAVVNFQNALIGKGGTLAASNNVSVRSIDRSGGNPVKNCTAWNNGPPVTFTVPGHGFLVNQPVLAEGMKTTPGGSCPRGRYLIAAVIDANTISLQGAGTPTAPLRTGGFRAAVYTYNAITNIIGAGFSKRNKGRPSNLAVGRRRTPSIKRV